MQIFKKMEVDPNWRIQYNYCQKCGLIHSFDNSFFENVAYADHYFEHVDSGWKERGDEILTVFDQHFRNKKSLKVLDICAGQNYYVSRLVQVGCDAYGVDAHSKPHFAKDRFYRDFASLPRNSLDLIVEHLRKRKHGNCNCSL